jgi:hypothetical protein
MDYLQPRRRNKPLFYLTVATLLVLLTPFLPFTKSGGGSPDVVAARPAADGPQAPIAPRPARDS